MKKVTVFVGSAHKRNTHKAAVQLMTILQALGEVNYEIVTLSDYEIKIKGHLDPRWSDWFEDLALTHLASDETLLARLLPHQAALHGLLDKF